MLEPRVSRDLSFRALGFRVFRMERFRVQGV